jgi:hypothetical protein
MVGLFLFVIFGLLWSLLVVGPAALAAGLKVPLLRWEMIIGLAAVCWMTVDWLLDASPWRIPAATLTAGLVTFGLIGLVTVPPLVIAIAVLGIGIIPAAACSWLLSRASSGKGG